MLASLRETALLGDSGMVNRMTGSGRFFTGVQQKPLQTAWHLTCSAARLSQPLLTDGIPAGVERGDNSVKTVCRAGTSPFVPLTCEDKFIL